MNLNGGYAMIKHDATQKELEVAYKTKRPILLYDEEQRAHWAQVIEKENEYSYQLLNSIEALVDDSGNPRFIEGEGTPATIEGFTSTYCKWSLSGTHLMCVVAGTIANGTAISANTDFATFTIPSFIYNKIYPVWVNNIDIKSISAYAQNWTTQGLTFKFQKLSDSKLGISETSAVTFTAERNFRIQFDLLIDAE